MQSQHPLGDYLQAPALVSHTYSSRQWGSLLAAKQYAPDLSAVQLAMIGTSPTPPDDKAIPSAADAVRQQLYALYCSEAALPLIDLGNIRACPSPTDTHYALAAVVEWLLQQGIVPIIIGETAQQSLGQLWGHAAWSKKIQAALLMSQFDLAALPYLQQWLQHPQLADLNLLAYQRAYSNPNDIDHLEKKMFDCCGLGELRPDLQEIEPYLRHQHLLAFDLAAVRHADAPATLHAPPAGLTAEETLSVVRYAGLSDHVTSLGLYGYVPALDHRQQTAQLVAQMIWYFVEGFNSRKNDIPEQDEKYYWRYIVNFKDHDHEVVFLKSKKTNRWWMRVPSTQANKGYVLCPCSYNDYQIASHNEIPDRWLKALLRWA